MLCWSWGNWKQFWPVLVLEMWVRQEEVGLWCMSCVVMLKRHIFVYRDSTMLFSLVFSIGILCVNHIHMFDWIVFKYEFGIAYVFGVVYEYGIGIVFFCNHIWETIWIVTSNINKEFYLVHTTNSPMHTNQWIEMSWNKELYFIYAANTSNLMCTQATLVHMSNSEIWNNGEIKKN